MSTATQSLQPIWDRVRRSWRASPLPGFFGWWGGELRALLPPRWRGWFSSGADWHLLQCAGTEWTLRRAGHAEILACCHDSASLSAGDTLVDNPHVLDERSEQVALAAALQRIDREDLRVALLLPTTAVLRRNLVLPSAARDNLQQVVAFEMDRQTPFNVAQVYYAARELPSPVAAGRLHAELVAVTRGTLDPLLARLRTLGISIDAVDLAVGDDRLGVNLLPPEQRPRRIRPRLRLNLALLAACAVLLVLVLGQWLHNRQAALEQMQSEVENMRGEAQQVATLRQQLQENAGAAGFLAQRKKNTIAMLSVLLDMTERLPDTTWLERFNIDNTGQVGLQGQSQQAAKLLDVLKSSPSITDASIQGSIQTDPTTGKERFYLVAQLQHPAAGKPKSAAALPAAAGSTP